MILIDITSKVLRYKIRKFVDMNRTIISIEVQDEGGKEANIIVRGERNGQILFEELFKYHDEEKHPLRLHLLKELAARNRTAQTEEEKNIISRKMAELQAQDPEEYRTALESLIQDTARECLK